ncbi:MAG: suppressor of loss of ypt1 [Claussenomyces sp. TS43310]|nr:MAG: suppressor of loss of ypt1 [Claussenomyces sp. TS43310]
MPHSTSPDPSRLPRESSAHRQLAFKFPADTRSSMEKFPDHSDSIDAQFETQSSTSISSLPNGHANGGGPSVDRWPPRREGGSAAWSAARSAGRTHGRQKSLTDAFRTIRTRRGSVSENAQEIAEALKAPVSPRLIILCIVWYSSSALTNTSSKSILNTFSKPATLTLIQFAFVATYCVLFSKLASIFPDLKTKIPALRHGIKPPTRDVILTTLPLAAFQIGGHLLSAKATTKIPVSLVHTIKGLSPLFTVMAYRIVFDIRYPVATYISLIPLTAGVMLACSAEFRGNITGIACAFLAAIIFVTQNIFSKRLFNEAAKAEADGLHVQSRKLDKLNLLCYSSGLAFILTAPIWFWAEGLSLLRDFFHDGKLDLVEQPEAFDHGRLTLEFVFNGIFHFGQNIIAFVLLSMVSPVTYSVASLIKRVFVVVVAIIWFQNPTTKIQAAGIALTFFGLYLYDRTSDSNKADRKARMLDIRRQQTLLPINTLPVIADHSPQIFESPMVATSSVPYSIPPAVQASQEDRKKSDDAKAGRPRGQSGAIWLPPGTKAEETWRPNDLSTNGVPHDVNDG